MSFESSLSPFLNRYVDLKVSLGRDYSGERRILESLDRFLQTQGATDLDIHVFDEWCHANEHLSSGVQRNWQRIVRNFCLYRRRFDPDCFVPDQLLFPANHQPVRPYIFTEDQIAHLLDLTTQICRTVTSPLSVEVFRLAIILLYCTGLRRGELIRLMVGDYDPGERVLTIRCSKFHKSRILPLPEDIALEMERFLQKRSTTRPQPGSDIPLLCNRSRNWRGYTGTGLTGGIKRLLHSANIRKSDGRAPRVHDFRHSFAVNALLHWYHEGIDVENKLPCLAAYMGHVSVVSTQYYLHFIEPLRTLASQRFARCYGQLINPGNDVGRMRS
jgi:integrase